MIEMKQVLDTDLIPDPHQLRADQLKKLLHLEKTTTSVEGDNSLSTLRGILSSFEGTLQEMKNLRSEATFLKLYVPGGYQGNTNSRVDDFKYAVDNYGTLN